MTFKLFPRFTLPPVTAALFLCLSIVATLVVIVQSLAPSGPTVSVTHFDKIMHFVSYGVLVSLWGIALRLNRLWGVTLVLIALGVGLEIAQHIMDFGRAGSIWDGLANAAGAVLAAFMLKLVLQPTGSRSNSPEARA